ncbi:MAG: hypothetical protein WEA11_06320 [Acidimicrobiales bacterium]
MTARRIVLTFAALALVAAAFVLPFGSSSNSDANAVTAPAEPVTAFTIIDDGQGLCDLYSIELATGLLTNLPAASSDAACVFDLAVAPNGIVYGITGRRFFNTGSLTGSADSLGGAELVTFSADGTPSGTSLTVDDLPISGVSSGSIAVNAAGVVYVIAINETTCDPRLSAPESFDPSDTYAFHCLFTVNLATGALTQIGEGFAPNAAVLGLTSCASTMWTISPGMFQPAGDNQPATVAIPWFALDPTTAIPTPGGIGSEITGYDCLATGDTVYALSTSSFGMTANSLEPKVRNDATLGTIDPHTGVFTPTVALSDPQALIAWFLDFAVVPPPVVPEPVVSTTVVPTTVVLDPVAPIFTH